MNFKLNQHSFYSKKFHELGIDHYFDAMKFIRNLPYGRNSNKNDLSLVLTEKRGTCSTKHALLKILADENLQYEIKLIIGIFKMNEENTPQLTSILEKYNLKYIPEAHTYLKFQDILYDCTSSHSSALNFSNDLIEEIEINPKQIDQFKVNYHKDYLQNWIKDKSLSLDKIWKIREECIRKLSENQF